MGKSSKIELQEATDQDHQKIAKSVGPGTWYILHKKAANIKLVGDAFKDARNEDEINTTFERLKEIKVLEIDSVKKLTGKVVPDKILEVMKDDLITTLYWLSGNFACMICRGHMSKYFKENPPEKWKDQSVGNDPFLGLFYYLYTFHSIVSRRIEQETGEKKYTPKFDDALSMFLSMEGCSKSCGI